MKRTTRRLSPRYMRKWEPMELIIPNFGGDMLLNAYYVTGLVEGEGSFSVSFNIRRMLNVGIETSPSFSISLNQRDLELLKSIKEFFGCGGIKFSRVDRTYKYEVRAVKDLFKKIIPYFRNFPQKGSKQKDLELFAKICEMVNANLHLDPSYLREIIEMAYKMNPSGKRRYRKEELLRVFGEVKV